MKRTLIWITSTLFLINSYGQIMENFSDGNFTESPEWLGDQLSFVITGNQLNSQNDPDNGGLNSYYLSTSSSIVYDATWQFTINLDFSTSGANYVDVYLVSDELNLNQSSNGYFLRFGDTADEIVLYKKSGGNVVSLVDGLEGIVDSSSDNLFTVRVTRDASNLWTLEIDDGNLGVFTPVGQIQDSEITFSSAFGFLIQQSSANSAINGHFFDEIVLNGSVYPDSDPPELDTLLVDGDQEIRLFFSEEIIPASATDVMNYGLTEGAIITDAIMGSSGAEVLLITQGLTNGNTYQISLTGIDDLAENTIEYIQLEFDYIVFDNPQYRDVVINEFLSDPTPSQGLPAYDFVEIYNRSDKFIDLSGWKVFDNSSFSVLPFYQLNPGDHLILCDQESELIFNQFGDVLGLESFPNFNATSADRIRITDSDDNLIDEIHYDLSSQNGLTLELINPTLECVDILNYLSSTGAIGGTPGTVNSRFSDEFDLLGPVISSISILENDTIAVRFNEPVVESSIQLEPDIVEFIFSGLRTVKWKSTVSLLPETVVEVVVPAVSDCQGNSSLNLIGETIFDRVGPQLERVKVLSGNEIALIFHEELKESVAEDESNYLIEGLTIKSGNGAQLQDSARNRVHLEIDGSLYNGEEYSIHVSGIEDTLGNGSVHHTFITYDDPIQSVKVLSSGIVVLEFDRLLGYSEDIPVFHFLIPSLGNPDFAGWNPDLQEVYLGFDTFIKPNKTFHLYIEDLVDKDGFKLTTSAQELMLDTKAPSLVSLEVNDKKLRLIFNEELEIYSAINLNNYEIVGDNNPLEAVIPQDSVTVELHFQNSFPNEVELGLIYQDISDLNGNSIGPKQTSFNFDETPPALVGANQYSPSTIHLEAHEPLFYHSLIESNFRLNDLTPEGIEILGPDSTRIYLHFNKIPLQESANLEIIDWKDHVGNQLENPISVEINTYEPIVSDLLPIDTNQLELRFSHAMEPASLKLENFSINGERPVEVDNQVITTDFGFKEGQIHQLFVEDLISSDGTEIKEEEIPFLFQSYFSEWSFSNPQLLTLEFETSFSTIEVEKFISKYPIQFVHADPQDPTKVNVLFSSPVPNDSTFDFQWTTLFDVWGRRIPDNSFSVNYDTKPPRMVSVDSYFDNSLVVHFDESIELNTIHQDQFQLSNGSVPIQFKLEGENRLYLTFDTLINSQIYVLKAERIADLHDNFMGLDSIEFTYFLPHLPNWKDLIITELMVDPDPSVGLPGFEYIEILNRSTEKFNLGGLIFSDENFEVTFPDFVLQPGDYLAIADERFPDSVHAITLSDFPTLDNNGETLLLKTIYDEVIDQINYTKSWYRDTLKENGGFSLELINPLISCITPDNWVSSNHPSGGTPGYRNSVYGLQFDTIPPLFMSHVMKSHTQLTVQFNEFLLDTLGEITFAEEHLQVKAIEIVENEVSISFTKPVEVGKEYTLIIDGVFDCSQNQIRQSLSFGVGKTPSFNDVIISEIMFDPQTDQWEYLEIFNTTSELVSLDSMHVFDSDGQTNAIGGTIGSGKFKVLTPTSASLDNNSIPIANWVTLSNSGELIGLESLHRTIFSTDYSQSIENQEIGGRSLEMADLSNPCMEEGNWLLSNHSKGGTPGLPNSHQRMIQDVTAPDISNVYTLSSDSLVITFTEKINSTNTKPFIRPTIEVVNWQINRDSKGMGIKVRDSLLFGETYHIGIQQLDDCVGNFSERLEKEFHRSTADVRGLIVSEILFNPEVGGFDFVEIVNPTSDYKKLENLRIAGGEQKYVVGIREVIEPNQYIAFTENRDNILFVYKDRIASNVRQVSKLPAFPDKEGSLRLIGEDQLVVDSVYYHESFHSPFLQEVSGVSLERIDFSKAATDGSHWHSCSSLAGYATPGKQNSHHPFRKESDRKIEIEPKVFIPGGSRNSNLDFTLVHFDFGNNPQVGKIQVFDTMGNVVKDLKNHGLLPATGTVKWDGTNNSGNRVPIGHYFVVIELQSIHSRPQHYREIVVVAPEF